MSRADFSHIRGIIWDLDNTLYRYDAPFIEACNIAAAKQAIAMGLDLPFEEALALATESEKTYGSSFRLFAERGLLYRDFHFPYHDAVDTTIVAKNTSMKTALETLVETRALPMVILTNASRHWARKTVAHHEFGHIFDDAKIIALEDVDFKAKAYHPDGFERGLSLLGTTAQDTLVVEDLARNLPVAKRLGLTTALVHAAPSPDHVDHIDAHFDTTLELTQHLLQTV